MCSYLYRYLCKYLYTYLRNLIFICTFWCNFSYAETSSGDVYKALLNLSLNIKEIRQEMGVVFVAKKSIDVINVQPREVYFQAQTVVEKISRLH